MPHYTSADGLTLHYTDEGTGTPVLCLSGLTRNGTDFDFVAPHLSGVRLIRPDYRGRGRSDWAKDFSTYSVLQEAQDVLDLMAHLGLDRAAILGTSRGGLTALTLAAMARDRLLGVCFNDVGPEVDMSGIAVIMSFLGRNPVWKSLGEAAAARPEIMQGFANVPTSRWREEVERLFHQTPDGLIITYDPRLRDAVELSATAEVPDLWPFYEALAGLPVAVIRGEHSNILSAETFAEMGRRLPDAITTTVADRGHVPFLDEPEALEVLRKWVNAL